MGRAFACFRYGLIAGVVLLGISGVAVAIGSGYFIYELHEYTSLTPNNVCGSPATLLAMGIITCGIGWFGWQFLNFSNRNQVIVFASILAVIMFVETGVGIWALIRQEQMEVPASTQHDKIFSRAVTTEKSMWNHMQLKLRCCGINGPSDYRDHRVNAIPWSCCSLRHLSSNNSTEYDGNCGTIYTQGCQHAVLNRTRSILLHVFLLSLCSVLLQVVFIACMTWYARIYRDNVDKRASEVDKRSSLQDTKEPDTKNNLLSGRARYLHNSNDP